MIRVAVLGSGQWGRNHVRNFHALGCLGAVCDKDPRVLAAARASYPDVTFTPSYRELLDDARIDAVVIATPAETHHALARQALLAGKHVLVEKPLSLTESDGRELVELAETSGRILMVGHVLRYHSVVRKLKELIDAGALGKLHYVYSNRLNIGKIRSEENILWSFAPHDVSVMLMLLGEFPVSVSAWGGNYLQPNVADVTMTNLEFPSGVKGHIFVSWLHPVKEQKLVVVGDRRMAVFDDLSDEKLRLYEHTIEWRERRPVAQKAEPEVVQVDPVEPLRSECQHFIDCISRGDRPVTDGREGLQVLLVLNACERSLQRGGAAVLLEKPASDRAFYAHPTAVIDERVSIGAGTKIWHFSHVLPDTTIGGGCSIGQNVMIGPSVTVGKRCKIQNNVSIYSGVTLEDEVFCGPSMVFTNVVNPRAAIKRMNELKPTIARRGATIGANATIVCGNVIGRHAFVGAGSVVTRDVADHALVVGNPARRVGWMCECGVRLCERLLCSECGKQYGETDQGGLALAPSQSPRS